ncbi:MAG: hypothetical protein NC240_01710 [Clostridium sp.]|nr:hypothetical protein [Clostridium sp.]
MKPDKIFKTTMVCIATLFILGIAVYSSISFISKNESNTKEDKKKKTEQALEQEVVTEQTTEGEKTEYITEQISEEITEEWITAALETTETVNTELMYGDILDLYKRALSEEWEFDLLEENKLNYMCRYHIGTGLEDIGYTFYDINEDGLEELIVGEIEGLIFDVYTCQDEQVFLIAQSTERNRFDICKDGIMPTVGSGGAKTTYYIFYVLEAGARELKYLECVALNADLDLDNPYFYTTEDPYDETLYTHIDEETANNIMGKYEGVYVGSFTPFAQYN